MTLRRGSSRATGLAHYLPLSRNRSGPGVRWFDRWEPALDDALAALPEMDTCPHELFRALAMNLTPAHKRIALVTEDGVPIAVVALRRNGRFWEPVCQGAVPGAVAPARPARLTPALRALGIDVRVAGWLGPLPAHADSLRDLHRYPVYVLPTDGSIERHWRSSSLYRNIVTARNRCASMTFAVDAPGADAWIIGNAAASYGATDTLADSLLATRYLVEQGRAHTFALLDGDRFVAGSTAIAAGDIVVGQAMYRDPAYQRQDVGTRLLDLQFAWTCDVGYRLLDIGPGQGFEYKARWGHESGERAGFSVRPAHLQIATTAVRTLRRVLGPRHGEGHSMAGGSRA